MKLILLLLVISAVALVIPATNSAQNPDDDPFNRALTELKAGNTDKAIAALTEAIKKNPDNADAYLIRSSLRMTSGDTPGALADVNKTLQLKPGMGQAYHERAILRLIARDRSGALQDLDAALARDYKGDGIYSLRGQLRAESGDLKGALADLDESMKLNPNNPQTYGSRGGVLLALNERDRALNDFNFLLNWYETEPTKRVENKKPTTEKPPGTADANKPAPFNVGIAAQTVNPAPGDKEVLPVIASVYINRGLIYSAQGKSDAAISDFTKSIRVDAKNVWPFYHRANELEGKGDLAAALADISRAIQLDPLNGNLRVEHGVILTLLGNTKDAQVDFDMLLQADRVTWQKRIDERLAAVKMKVPK